MKKPKPPLFSAARISSLAALVTLGVILANVENPSKSKVSVVEKDGQVRVTWPVSGDKTGSVIFSMDESKPLIESMSVGEKTIATGLNPSTVLTVGSRNMDDAAGWVAFFDNPPKRKYDRYSVKLGKRSLKVAEQGAHTIVTVAEATAGNFSGEVRFTFYRNSGLMQAETVLSTQEDGRAIVYDTGLTSANPDWKNTVWKDTNGNVQSVPLNAQAAATPLEVEGRTIVAEGKNGASLAVFPAPHRYFYPLDEAFNLKFVWHGKNYVDLLPDSGLGIRQELTGDNRFVPWFNAPPHTKQQLGVFFYLTDGDGKAALDAVAKYTRNDHYKPLAGYKTFTSHYHVEHTLEFVRKQKEQNTKGVPKGLEVPGMVKTFKKRGVNVVHLAELHVGETPRMTADERLPLLKVMHEECDRLSDEDLLMLPGEEPNVHLGGHWISFFPKPVYWVLNRPDEKPYAENVPGYGKVYHVGNPEEVLKLMEEENGLMWTAHARIKASMGYPDRYRKSDFYKSEHFLGAAWKAMPADLSRPTLGWRVLDLLDDSSNWGLRKHVLGESDLFRMEPHFETYAHMNINYVKLDKLPKYKDGWQPLLDSLRGGDFFTTTGEILIPNFTVDGKESGKEIPSDAGEKQLLADVEWTYPLSFAEIVSGDGKQVFRQRIDLSDCDSFGSKKLQSTLNLKGRTWVRLEVWDIAGNGAYTQPVWIGPKPAGDFAEEAKSLPLSKDALAGGFDTVVPAANTEPALWKWTDANPGHEWAENDFDDSAWNDGKSAFGSEGTPGTAGRINTPWKNEDIWIRRQVKLPENLSAKTRLLIHHDNHAEVYIDGILAWKSADIETRDYSVFEITPEAAAKLKPGATVTIAAHGLNVLGGQVLDVGIVTLK